MFLSLYLFIYLLFYSKFYVRTFKFFRAFLFRSYFGELDIKGLLTDKGEFSFIHYVLEKCYIFRINVGHIFYH